MSPVPNAGHLRSGRPVHVAGGSTSSSRSIIPARNRGEAGTDSCSPRTPCSTRRISRAECSSARGSPSPASMCGESRRPGSSAPSARIRPTLQASGACPRFPEPRRRKRHRNAPLRILPRPSVKDTGSASIAGVAPRSGGGARRSPRCSGYRGARRCPRVSQWTRQDSWGRGCARGARRAALREASSNDAVPDGRAVIGRAVRYNPRLLSDGPRPGFARRRSPG